MYVQLLIHVPHVLVLMYKRYFSHGQIIINIVYNACPNLEGIKEVLYNNFWMLGIGQIGKALCISIVIMEMHFVRTSQAR